MDTRVGGWAGWLGGAAPQLHARMAAALPVLYLNGASRQLTAQCTQWIKQMMLRLAGGCCCCCCTLLLLPAGPEAGQAALRLYKRAAQQGNIEALLRIGDGYWYGKQGVGRDWLRAAQVRKRGGTGCVQEGGELSSLVGATCGRPL